MKAHETESDCKANMAADTWPDLRRGIGGALDLLPWAADNRGQQNRKIEITKTKSN